MSIDKEQSSLFLKSLHLDFENRQLTLQATDDSATKLTISPEGVIYEYVPRPGALSDHATPVALEPTSTPDVPEHAAAAERESAMLLTGKLKSKPQDGRPDNKGNPTAWARFAAHEQLGDGRSRAHMYSTTFHGETRAIALRLGVETPLEVKGFSKPASAEGRLDNLSVVDIVRIGDTQTQQRE